MSIENIIAVIVVAAIVWFAIIRAQPDDSPIKKAVLMGAAAVAAALSQVWDFVQGLLP